MEPKIELRTEKLRKKQILGPAHKFWPSVISIGMGLMWISPIVLIAMKQYVTKVNKEDVEIAYELLVGVPIVIFVVGFVLWLVGKHLDSKN